MPNGDRKRYESMDQHLEAIRECFENSPHLNQVYWRIDALTYSGARGRRNMLKRLQKHYNIYPGYEKHVIKIGKRY